MTTRISQLSPADLESFAKLRIPEELLELAKVQRVTAAEARERFGILFDGSLDGIAFPYFINGSRVTARLRRDNPESDEKGKPQNKYICAFGDRRHLYVLPGYEERLADPQTVFLYVEAEKSVLAIEAWAKRMKVSRPVLPFGCGGCWGWKGQVGITTTANGERAPEKGPLPEIGWAGDGRQVGIIFDANVVSNPKVQQARKKLRKQLEKQGAKVSVLDLPAIEGVNGVDDFIAAAGDQAFLELLEGKSRNQVDPTNALDSRPVIVINAGEVPQATDRAEEVLLDHAVNLKLFQRSGEVVRIVTLPEAREEGSLRLPVGAVIVEPVNRVVLQEILERLICFQKLSRGGELYAVDCPAKIAEFYLSRTGSRRLPVLTGVISAPLLLDDGTALENPGYDDGTGLYFISNEAWLEVPKSPTLQDARDALAFLSHPFSQFPFCTEADRATHLAGIITAIQRRLLPTAPLFAYKAPERRTGKSLLAESVAIISTGRPAPATATSSNEEEFRKTILAALYRGHAVINLDNLERPLASPSLCIALTQETYEDRILGESRMVQLPTRTLWTCTGNNLVLKGDLTVRALLCSIDAGTEHPEERDFRIPDLHGFLKEYRPELVHAALTILKAFHVAGQPKQNVKSWGGFNEWSRLIREPLVWVGLPDPIQTREAISTDDPDREGAAILLQSLRQAFQDDHFTLKEAIRLSTESSQSVLHDALHSVAGRKGEVDTRVLGWWCRKWRDRVIDGLQLRADGQEHRYAKWKIVDKDLLHA